MNINTHTYMRTYIYIYMDCAILSNVTPFADYKQQGTGVQSIN